MPMCHFKRWRPQSGFRVQCVNFRTGGNHTSYLVKHPSWIDKKTRKLSPVTQCNCGESNLVVLHPVLFPLYTAVLSWGHRCQRLVLMCELQSSQQALCPSPRCLCVLVLRWPVQKFEGLIGNSHKQS